MKINKRSLFLILVLAFVVLAALFAFYDLQISQTVFNPKSGWTHFLEAYGQLPGMLVTLLGANLIARLRVRKTSFWNRILTLLVYLYGLFSAFGIGMEIQGMQIGNPVSMLLALGIAIALTVILQVLFFRISVEKLEKYRIPALVAVWLSILAPLVTTWIIKILWGRVSFRELSANFKNFTPWFLPQGNTGHTSMAWSVLPIILLFKNNGSNQRIAWIVVAAWGILAAASRVVIGAHFASDVLFASAQTILWFCFLKKKFSAE